MPKHTTPNENNIYDDLESDVQKIIDRLGEMISERDDEIERLKNSLSDMRIEKNDEIAGLKEQLRNQF